MRKMSYYVSSGYGMRPLLEQKFGPYEETTLHYCALDYSSCNIELHYYRIPVKFLYFRN